MKDSIMNDRQQNRISISNDCDDDCRIDDEGCLEYSYLEKYEDHNRKTLLFPTITKCNNNDTCDMQQQQPKQQSSQQKKTLLRLQWNNTKTNIVSSIIFLIFLITSSVLLNKQNVSDPVGSKLNVRTWTQSSEILLVDYIWNSLETILFQGYDNYSERRQRRRRLASTNKQKRLSKSSIRNKIHTKPLRILYIITTLAEYNTGTRATIRGSDRLQETTIPIMVESVNSMMSMGYIVDVYMVCHYTLLPEREALIHAALPKHVKVQIWNDATPLGYDTGKEPFQKLENRTLHLARQHRFVIKDKLLHYDVFVNFEDDMYITGHHVQHYVAVSNELKRLYEAANEQVVRKDANEALKNYYGPMAKNQLKRMIPGFIRVEVLLNEEEFSAQNSTGPIPIDMDFGKKGNVKFHSGGTVDSSICCNVSEKAITANRPKSPTADKLMIWETNILPLGIRKLPDDSWLDWTVLQRGPNQNGLDPTTEIIGDYWINRNNDYYPKVKRPAPQEFKYINNQGGWMATQYQLIQWHTDICPGGFLPPYEAPHYKYDGLDMRNVEWYSGGMHLTTVRHACNMQRIIQLFPQNFSKSLLYHTANNKQIQLSYKKDEFFTKANTMLGQLNTIKKRAEKEITKN